MRTEYHSALVMFLIICKIADAAICYGWVKFKQNDLNMLICFFNIPVYKVNIYIYWYLFLDRNKEKRKMQYAALGMRWTKMEFVSVRKNWTITCISITYLKRSSKRRFFSLETVIIQYFRLDFEVCIWIIRFIISTTWTSN